MKFSDEQNKEGFYRAFEDQHRGPRDLIISRLAVYLPFVEPLRDFYQPASAVDLGCGRGEWLELLLKNEFKPLGVDLDAGMLSSCAERGLPTAHGDAITHLRALDDESQCVVSGFHVAEHLDFDALNKLVRDSFRVLKPGGILILETPNPENVIVGTSSFYLDPTHQRPIPPLLLSFLAEYHGFTRVNIVRLQEQAELHDRTDVRIIEVLGGVSPDYAVVAQKATSPEIMARFDSAFAAHHGIELHELADRYDAALDRRLASITQRLDHAEDQAFKVPDTFQRIDMLQGSLSKVHAQTARLHSDVARLQKCVERISQASESDTLLPEQYDSAKTDSVNSDYWRQLASGLEMQRKAMLESVSWRITAPLRFVGDVATQPSRALRFAANDLIHRTINAAERPLARAIAAVLRRPQVSQRINQWLFRYPALYQQLASVARRRGVVPNPSAYLEGTRLSPLHATSDLVNLTPRALQIYDELKVAIEKNGVKR